MNRIIFSILFLGASLFANATHNRAGEITYKWLGGRTYEVVITTYTKISAQADRCELTLDWGDFSSSVLIRENGPTGSCGFPAKMGESVGNDIRKNIYRGQHTYQSPGFYTLAMQDLNRNSGIANIPNSINVPFYITTVLNVNPALGTNSSPQLLNPPIDKGCLNQLFIHNPGAWDPDGDSLGYELIDCRGLGGAQITQTYSPQLVQDAVTIDPITGDFIWDKPKNQGQFNFAILISEYRKGPNGIWQVVGQITRDMQIDIDQCSNQPPVLQPVGPFCIEVGKELSFTVKATDPDNNQISLTATGGPLIVETKAQFFQPTSGVGSVQQVFKWTPDCVHVQKQPWFMYFKVEDNPSSPNDPPLVDYLPVEITVIAPAPQNPQAVPTINSTIDLSWNKSICTNAIGYKIYRREGFYGYTPDSCETGVPEYTGYSFLAEVDGHLDTTYIDSTDIKRGMKYCYMVTAFFADESESIASVEVCTELEKTAPIITNVDVLTTDAANGKIEVKWLAPRVIDTAAFPPPYSYGLERANNIDGSSFIEIKTFTSLQDTNFVDSVLNTQDQGYAYRVALYSGQNNVLIGRSDAASSVFLSIFPFDLENRLTFNFSVPWNNDWFVVYKETSPGSGIFDSLTTTNTTGYTDTGLVNAQVYCYKVKAIGNYTGDNLPDSLINNSQIACASPLDTIAPCSPEFSSNADCENGVIEFMWTNPTGEFCGNDIVYYNIYYKPTQESEWPNTPLVANLDVNQLSYTYTNTSIVGCYGITAVDNASPPNESDLSNIICVDGCPVIELPNVFSPNGTPPNNYFRPVRNANGEPRFKDIERFNIQVFNRWGTLVYESSNPDDFVETGWDGKDKATGQDVAAAVYFYVFTYTPKSVNAPEEKLLKGTVTIFR